MYITDKIKNTLKTFFFLKYLTWGRTVIDDLSLDKLGYQAIVF